MSATISVGRRLCFGIKPEWLSMKINNLPPDTLKVRCRFRHMDIAKAFVKTTNGVTEYILAPDGDGLRLETMFGSNTRG